MPVDIVDLLKTIEVHAQDCKTSAFRLRQFQDRAQAFAEGHPIWQVGQRVAMRHMRDALLRLPPLRYIVEQGEKIFRLAVLAPNCDLLGDNDAVAFRRRNCMVADDDGFARRQNIPRPGL